jgi:transposase
MPKYEVLLDREERAQIFALTHRGQRSARMIIRASILRLSDAGKTDRCIAHVLDISVATVARTRKKYVQAGLAYALEERLHPGGRRKLTRAQERLLVRMARQAPGLPRERLTEHFAQVAGISISLRTIQRILGRAGVFSRRWE